MQAENVRNDTIEQAKEIVRKVMTEKNIGTTTHFMGEWIIDDLDALIEKDMKK